MLYLTLNLFYDRLQDLLLAGMTRCQESAGVVMGSILLSVQSILKLVCKYLILSHSLVNGKSSNGKSS